MLRKTSILLAALLAYGAIFAQVAQPVPAGAQPISRHVAAITAPFGRESRGDLRSRQVAFIPMCWYEYEYVCNGRVCVYAYRYVCNRG